MTKSVNLKNLELAMIHAESIPKRAKWWCQLNRWEWPKDFPIVRPSSGDLHPHKQMINEFMDYIVTSIGKDIVLKEWNK